MKKVKAKTKAGQKQYKIMRYTNYGFTEHHVYLPDLIAIMAANVEDAYITAGITDYTAKECFDKGFLLALEMFKNDDKGKIEFDISYPDYICEESRKQES